MAALHREPTREEISRRLGWEENKVRAVLEAVPEVSSLHQPLGSESGARRLVDLVEEQDSHDTDLREILQLQEAMRRLPERERLVLVRRYGLDKEGTKATVRELSARLGISEKAVRRAQRRAEQLLRTLLDPGTRGNGLGEVTI